MTAVVISQPMLFPWPGFFEQLALADGYIYLDDAQYSKGSFTNRIQLLKGNDRCWMTIPLAGKGSFQKIQDLSATADNWRASHRSLLRQSLDGAPYIDDALAILDEVYANDSVRTPERVRRYSKFMDLPGAHHSFAKTAEQIVPPDAAEFEAQLKTISVPTLAIWGEEDKIVPIEYGRRMRRDVPNIQYFTFAGTGHAPQEEQPAATADRLLKFLESLR